MSVFLRYLLSMMVHMTWMRMGKGGPVPPLKIPRKGPVNLPVIGPWQVMIGMWLMNKMWEKYGRDVKTHLADTGSSVAKRVGSLLPDPKNTPAASPASSNAARATSGSTTPATVSAAAPAAPPIASPAPAPSHDTQVLSSAPANPQNSSTRNAAPQIPNQHDADTQDTDAHASNSQRLPQGSLLSRLRGAKPSN